MGPGDSRPINAPPDSTPNKSPPAPRPTTPPVDPATNQLPALIQPLTLSTLLSGFKRRWPLAIAVGLVAALVGAAAAWVVIPGRYQAEAVLKMDTIPHLPGLGYQEGEFVNFTKTQMVNTTSDPILVEALSKPEVAGRSEVQSQSDKLVWLKKNLLAENDLSPELLRVTLAGDRPEDLAIVLNAVVNAYMKDFALKEDIRSREEIKQLELSHDHCEAELRDMRQNLQRLYNQFGLVDPDTAKSQAQVALQRLTTAEQEDERLKRELAAAQVILETDRAKSTMKIDVIVSELDIDDAKMSEVAFKEAKERVAKYQADLDDIMRVTADQSRVATFRNQLVKAEASLREQRNRYRPEVEDKKRGKVRMDLLDSVSRLEKQIQSIVEQRKVLARDIEKLKGDYESLAGNRQALPSEVASLRDKITQQADLQTLIDKDLGKHKLARSQLANPETLRVRLLQEAKPPTQRDNSRQLKYAAVTGLGLFVLGILGVCLVECLGRRVYGVNDVSQGLGMTLLGTLPAMPANARKPTPATTPEEFALQAPMIESVDTIRTVLLRGPSTVGLKVVMVTSALGGEGKTSLACHLAASLARAGKRTVLLDGDLRNPAVHQQFDLPLEPGFSEYLRAEMEFDDIQLPSPVTDLSVIPAGRWTPATSQALAHEAVGNCFDYLRENYDFVVVDVPPVLLVADALMVAQHADAAVFAVLRDVSRLPSVHTAHQRLASLGVRVLGAVMIGEKPISYGKYAPQVAKTTK